MYNGTSGITPPPGHGFRLARGFTAMMLDESHGGCGAAATTRREGPHFAVRVGVQDDPARVRALLEIASKNKAGLPPEWIERVKRVCAQGD